MMNTELSNEITKEVLSAFVTTNEGWIAFSKLCGSILAIYLVIFWKKRNRNKKNMIINLGFILYSICLLLIGIYIIELLKLFPKTLFLLISIVLIGISLIYGPKELIDYYKNEKKPKPWWKAK